MESPTSHLVAKDFQVTGVSRSGRVRKKSSKLLDFESPEEIEKRTRRQSGGRQPSRYSGRGRPSNALRDLDLDQEMLVDDPNISDGDEFHPETPTTAVTILNSDDELDNLVQDLVDGVQAEATSQESPVRQSLYMREKANKRQVLKDGKVVNAKVQRKDKGKQRYTAYSLWAREARKKDLQDLDFTSATRRLSELWANVSNREKNAWRRKAKIQASRAKTHDNTGASSTPQPTSNGNTPLADSTQHETIFQNRATTSRTRKLAADRQQSSLEAAAAAAAAAGTSTQRRSFNTRSARSQASTSATKQQSHTDANSGGRTSGQQKQEEQHKTSIEVIDAAAHLKLLGESLTVIGERLKKHNGYVALSGSLSVLLDSLLCAMGPLLCMTTQIPGMENKVQLSKNLADTLDNIAYVMPGL